MSRLRRLTSGLAVWACLGGGAAAIAEPPPDFASTTPRPAWESLAILGSTVEAGERKQLTLVVSESLDGGDLSIPVTVTRGVLPGPTLCLTGGVHGDEVNGIEVVRRVTEGLEPRELKGTVLSVPIVNLSAVRRGSRYLPDRRDLNRYFPGRASGSSASRIAHRFFENVARHCSALIDVHTGSFHRTNLHQLRADLRDRGVFDLARGLGAEIVVHSEGRSGTLRRAAVDAGIPAVTIEAGEPARLSTQEIDKGVASIQRLMGHLDMIQLSVARDPETDIFVRAHWVRAPVGGILVADVGLGQEVNVGDKLATITDPISSASHLLQSDRDGRVIGMAFDQLVMPGFAAVHVGVRPGDQDVISAGVLVEAPDASPEEDDDELPDELDLEERPEE